MIIWMLVGIALVALFYWKIFLPHQYWKNKGVDQGKQVLLFGDSLPSLLGQQSFAELVEYAYKKVPNKRYSGIYQLQFPTLVLKDPELIKQITVKDFDHFMDHQNFVNDDVEPLWSRNLFALRGDKWREMRTTLSPAFTSSKMRTMFSLMCECSEQFTNFLKNNQETSIELRDTFTRFTNDVIATCAFGIKCDSLKHRNNEFYLMGKEATNTSGFWINIKFVIMMILPKLSKLFGLTFFSVKVAKFFTSIVVDTVKMREEKNIVRPDMINLLMEARKGHLIYEQEHQTSNETGFATVEESNIETVIKKQKQEITDVDMTAQALIFFFAGFDSVSTLLCFMGYELAINPDIQDRLYQEIETTLEKCGGKITYEAINKMVYLDMIISETLRKWPPAISTDRECSRPYTIPAKYPGEVDVHLNKEDLIWIPVFGFHRDSQYFPKPEKFDPERFSEENKSKIKPYTYLPFGAGPRNCIASRFALLETKTAFVHLLAKMELVVVEKTEIPLKFSKSGFTLMAENGTWIGLKPRK